MSVPVPCIDATPVENSPPEVEYALSGSARPRKGCSWSGRLRSWSPSNIARDNFRDVRSEVIMRLGDRRSQDI